MRRRKRANSAKNGFGEEEGEEVEEEIGMRKMQMMSSIK
jgi:hypothetical protein